MIPSKLHYNKDEFIKIKSNFKTNALITSYCPTCKEPFKYYIDDFTSITHLNAYNDLTLVCYHENTPFEKELGDEWKVKIRVDLNISIVGE